MIFWVKSGKFNFLSDVEQIGGTPMEKLTFGQFVPFFKLCLMTVI
jgi:hypothetical protein